MVCNRIKHKLWAKIAKMGPSGKSKIPALIGSLVLKEAVEREKTVEHVLLRGEIDEKPLVNNKIQSKIE